MLCEVLKMNAGLTKLNLSVMDRDTETSKICWLMTFII